jgi:hypothetical protein
MEQMPPVAIFAGPAPRRIEFMMKFLCVLVCLAFAGSAVAGDRRPSKKAERQTEILRSLDRIEIEIVKARQKIDRLEVEMQSLREKLIGVASAGPEVADGPSGDTLPQRVCDDFGPEPDPIRPVNGGRCVAGGGAGVDQDVARNGEWHLV